ncbi:MAG TPA: hypothetical protein VGP93_10850, partial [Polyangiaceae bacterium]|nr:hypothetical protein [Polyangiaceae bacterium]
SMGGAAGQSGATGDSGAGGEAGTGASAGASGAGGAAPHNVLDCTALGAVGEWQQVAPPDLDIGCDPDAGVCATSASEALVLDPQNAGVIYLGTAQQGIWKSTDCGSSWAVVSTGKNGILLGASILTQLEIDPVDPQVLYTKDDNHEFKSENGGVDWEIIWPAGFTQAAGAVNFLVIDPQDHEHLLLALRQDCTAEFAPSCIAETFDAGATWGLLKTPGDGIGRPWFVDTSHWLFSQGGALWRTSDGGATWVQLADKSLGGVYGRMYRSPTGGFYLGADLGVVYSADGAVWSVLPNSGEGNRSGVVGSDTTLFTSHLGYCMKWGTDMMVYYSAPMSTHKPWTAMAAPGMTQGAVSMGYDLDHHVLYASACTDGFWRVVTE